MAARDLPSGTVTFLFTDIEGSTRLLHSLGQRRYDDLLTEHHDVLQAAFAAHEGRVVDTQGDSFFVAFRTANDAVAAAVDAQRDLAAHEWPEGAEIKVRMGLHTGEPRVGQERYVGIGVHRAARIGAAGHGGQVLLSSTTRELAEEDLPAGVAIRDLGERRLKDLEQPQRLYQLVVEGLENTFGPLKTLDVELARKRRRLYVSAALVGVLAAAVAIPVFALAQGGSNGAMTVEGNAVAEIDPASGKVIGEVPNVGSRPSAIASGSASLWVANLDDRTVARIDPATLSVVHTVPVRDSPTGLATSADAVWVVGSIPAVSSVAVRRIDPQYDTVTDPRRIPNVVPGGPGSVAARGRTVWVAPSSGLLSRVDPRTARVVKEIDPNSGPVGVALGADAIWVTDSDANTVTRVDPSGLLTPIPVGHGPSGIAVGGSGVWVAVTQDDKLVRIDPGTHTPTTTIPVGRAPVGVAVGEGAVWVANSGDGTVTRIDPANPDRPRTIRVGGSPRGVAVADGHVWVTVDEPPIAPVATAGSGGVARIDSANDIEYLDSGVSFYGPEWQLLYATCAKLVNYPDKPAPAGSKLVPEVARTLPSRSADGKTYTFAIRPGFRFSPPSNQPVTAQTFKSTIERTLNPKLVKVTGTQGFFSDIVGASAYMAGKAPHVSGVTASGNTLTVRLVAPAPNLLARLAMPFFCAVPIGTPVDPNGVRTIPSAGPYYFASFTPGRGAVLKANPNYHGSRPHRLDRIQVTSGVSAQEADSAIEAGGVDYNQGVVDPGDAASITARYGRGSAGARRGTQQYFLNTELAFDFIVLNTRRPLFRDARLRRAVNYAVDRAALARIGPLGSGPEKPTDQYLPPGMLGFKDAHVYPFTPDVARARRLVGSGRRTAVLYTCNQSPCGELAQTVKTNLAAIGIDIEVKTFPVLALVYRLGRPGEPYDLALGGGPNGGVAWLADYGDPEDFLNYLIGAGGGGLLPPMTASGYQRAIHTASKLSGPSRYLTYGRLDAQAARRYAPLVALANPVSRDFFSARMGCQVYNPAYGIDLAALCVKK